MKGWVTTTLGAAFTTVTGNTPPKNNPELFGQYMPLVKPPELRDAVVDSAEDGLSEAGTKIARVAPPNSILVSCIGNLGKVALNTISVAFNQQINAIFPDEARVVPEFMFYQVLSCDFIAQLNALASGTTVPIVNKSRFNSIEIVLPPLAEQQRIVGLLDEAFEGLATAKANAEKNLQNARALFESHLQAVFTQRGPGWVEKRIEEWCDSIMDCVNKTAPVVEGPTLFKMIRTTNVRHGRVDVSSVRYVTEETYQVWTRRQTPQKGDVILTREAPMGEVGMLLTDDKVFLGQRLVSYRANSAKLDNHFLLFALQSGDLQGQIHAKASGSTVQHMRVPDTKNLLLAAPPLAKQREVVAQLASLRAETQRLTSLYERKLAALEALKKALLHQAFAGEL